MLWGIEGVRDRTVELWVPSPRILRWNSRRRIADTRRSSGPDELGPIPITTPIRTLIDLAARLEDDRLLVAMESVSGQKLGTA